MPISKFICQYYTHLPTSKFDRGTTLAVQYPDCSLGMKRKDSFEAIREAGDLAPHLDFIPVQPLAEINTISPNNSCLEGNHSANDELRDAKMSEIGKDKCSARDNVENNTKSIEDAYKKLSRLS